MWTDDGRRPTDDEHLTILKAHPELVKVSLKAIFAFCFLTETILCQTETVGTKG
jgi:hypothetical protein